MGLGLSDLKNLEGGEGLCEGAYCDGLMEFENPEPFLRRSCKIWIICLPFAIIMCCLEPMNPWLEVEMQVTPDCLVKYSALKSL